MVRNLLNLDQFKKELNDAGDKLVVVEFEAMWCGPCKLITLYYNQLSESAEYSDVVFLQVDVEEAREFTESCKISALPTFQFYKNGNMLDKFYGPSKDELLEFLRRLK